MNSTLLFINKMTTGSKSADAFLFFLLIIATLYVLAQIVRIIVTYCKKSKTSEAENKKVQMQREISDALMSERNINNPKYFGNNELRTATRS